MPNKSVSEEKHWNLPCASNSVSKKLTSLEKIHSLLTQHSPLDRGKTLLLFYFKSTKRSQYCSKVAISTRNSKSLRKTMTWAQLHLILLLYGIISKFQNSLLEVPK